jgi:hypothetical protein
MTREYYARQVGAYQRGYRRGLEDGRDYCERRRARIEWAKLAVLIFLMTLAAVVAAYYSYKRY